MSNEVRRKQALQLLADNPELAKVYTVNEWGKLHHIASGKDVLPSEY